ncbi:MAG: hypothetical protein IKD54_10795, partial [Clostridia bacterium]|nr:hypothetical protein [Clostridia bacterium]
RKYLAQRAELLGAIRLPNNAFRANAGTDVVADIIFLQKRDHPIEIDEDWLHIGKSELGYPINEYFLKNPDMILGELAEESTRFGMGQTVKPIEGADLSEQLRDAIANIHGEIVALEQEDELEGTAKATLPADPDVRNFSFTLVNGEIYFRENSVMSKIEVSLTAQNRIKGMIAIRDCAHKLINLQLNDYSDAAIAETQAELNTLYDAYTAKYGLLNSRGNSMAFSDDSSYPLLCSLEVLDENGKLERKADMFYKRTVRQYTEITHVDTAAEALTVSLSEKAAVDLPYMAGLTGKSEDEIEVELSGLVFRDIGTYYAGFYNPDTFDLKAFPLVTADAFLSGNVRSKLSTFRTVQEKLQNSGKTDEAEALSVSITALEKVQPKDLDASEINVRLGATWIPEEDVKAFIFALSGQPCHIRKIDLCPFGKRNGQRFGCGVNMCDLGVLANGALIKHIRFSFQFPVLIEHLQRAEQRVRGIVRERHAVAAAVQKPVLCGVGVVKRIQLMLRVRDCRI